MRNHAISPLLVAVIAACAVGVGITGTLVWVEQRASVPTATPTASAPWPNAPEVPNNLPNPQLAPATPEASNAGWMLERANSLYDRQQWPQAIEGYRAVLASGVDNPNVRTDLGNALRFNGQPAEALKQYQIAQQQDPSHEQSLFNQGGLWAFSMNDPKRAVAAWQTYVKRFPNGQSVGAARQFIAQFGRSKGASKTG